MHNIAKKVNEFAKPIVNNPQFQSALWSSIASNVTNLSIQYLAAAIFSYFNSSDQTTVHLQRVDEAYTKALSDINNYRYHDALTNLNFAHQHFEKNLRHLLKKKDYLVTNQYKKLCYAKILAYINLGEFNSAQEMFAQHSSFANDLDLLNLAGLSYLKQNNFAQALELFKKSLAIFPGNDEVLFLIVYTENKIAASSENIAYLSSSQLFTLKVFSPFTLQVNFGILENLSEQEDELENCFRLVNELDKCYADKNLSSADRQILHALIEKICSRLQEQLSQSSNLQTNSSLPSEILPWMAPAMPKKLDLSEVENFLRRARNRMAIENRFFKLRTESAVNTSSSSSLERTTFLSPSRTSAANEPSGSPLNQNRNHAKMR